MFAVLVAQVVRVAVCVAAGILIVASLTPSAFGSGTIINLGTLGGTFSGGNAVSADGSTVVGYSKTANDAAYRAFRWTIETGMVDLGTLGESFVPDMMDAGKEFGAMPSMNDECLPCPAGDRALGDPWPNFKTLGSMLHSYAYGVSGDGAVVAGYSNAPGVPDHAFRWTVEGMVDLGSAPDVGSEARAISADGAVVAGYIAGKAALWSQDGIQMLGTLGGSNSWAFAVNDDGTFAAGESRIVGNTKSHAFRWSSAGMQDLGTLGGKSSYGAGISADGSAIVGDSYVTLRDYSPVHTFRWTDDGMQDLGTLGGSNSYGHAISGDGNSVVGISYRIFNNPYAYHAFLWTPSLGMVDLNSYLPSVGVDLSGWTLIWAAGISADGSAITGYGQHLGKYRAYLVTFSGAPCIGDATGDRLVNAADLAIVLNKWGQGSGAGDVNSDYFVDIDDLLAVINAWGSCP